MLGPMVNPSFPKRQMVGVFSLELARQYGYLYQDSDKDFVVLHALDGYDEISLTGPFKYFSNGGETILEPGDLGLPQVNPQDILGGSTVDESAAVFLKVLEGKGSASQNAAVVANAAMALYAGHQDDGVAIAVEKASEALESGAALKAFKMLMNQK
jgi:anthranilate phosphoribosyltransferase